MDSAVVVVIFVDVFAGCGYFAVLLRRVLELLEQSPWSFCGRGRWQWRALGSLVLSVARYTPLLALVPGSLGFQCVGFEVSYA